MPASIPFADETPLLRDPGNIAEETEEEIPITTERKAAYQAAQSRFVLQLCLLMLFWDFAQYLVIAPLTEVFEDIICKRYHAEAVRHPQPFVRDCKVNEVQKELALVKGWKDALSQVPDEKRKFKEVKPSLTAAYLGIILSLPLSLLADHVGRKPVILLFLLGAFLSDTWVKLVCIFPNMLPLRLVWLAPMLETIGGGVQVGTSMFFTIAADVSSKRDRASVFMKLSATEMLAQIVGTPLAATLMRRSNWLPLVISSMLLVVTGLLATTLPETHPIHRGAGSPLPDAVSEEAAYSGHVEPILQSEAFFGAARKLVLRTIKSSKHILQNIAIDLSLGVFLLVACSSHSWALLLQYVSKKFDWEYSTVNSILDFWLFYS
ncbi:MAG: hypothetical protein Q9160_001302 [Pyrenula sp. 1 TL-2023]